MTDRSDLIIQYFGFLISNYNYFVTEKKFDPQVMGNAFVIFKSSRIGIEIVIDRDQVLITLGDREEPKEKWFDFCDVLQYFNPVEVAYSDIDQLFNEKRAKHNSNEDTWNEVIDVQLQRLGFLLGEYCEPILKGNLDMKKELKVIEKRRVEEFINKLDKSNTTFPD